MPKLKQRIGGSFQRWHTISTQRACQEHVLSVDHTFEADSKCIALLEAGLSSAMQDEEVIRLFNDSSDETLSVKAVRIIRDPTTNIGKGFGYVLFSDKNMASMALAKEGLTIRKRPLRITRVSKPRTKAIKPEATSYGGALGAEGK